MFININKNIFNCYKRIHHTFNHQLIYFKTYQKSIIPQETGSQVAKIKALINEYDIENTSTIQKQLSSLKLKDFSLLTHSILLQKNKNPLIWKIIQGNFLNRMTFTSNPQEIRSYGKIAYCLVKAKNRKNEQYSPLINQNYETKFAILLPFATHQSFTVIVTSMSRMGPLSHQFTHIIESLYYKNYEKFYIREKIQINYVLTRNGHDVDPKLITQIDKMNLVQIVLMLRCYTNCDKISGQILKTCEKHILPRKKQMNIIDLSDICAIYFAGVASDIYKMSEEMQNILAITYRALRRNVNDVSFEKIWENFPVVVNKGFLKIAFVEDVIKTLSILKKNRVISDKIWKGVQKSFYKFENKEIKEKLGKIQ